MKLHKLALLTPIVGLVALMSTSIASAQFLDINGGFENGFSGWTRQGFVDESRREFEGDTAARLRSSDAEIRRTIQLQPNTRYRFRGRMNDSGRLFLTVGGRTRTRTIDNIGNRYVRRTISFNSENNTSCVIGCRYRRETSRFDDLTFENRDDTGFGSSSSSSSNQTARDIIGGRSNWKLNGYSGNLNVGASDNGLDYEDDASLNESHFFFERDGYAVFRSFPGNPTSGGSSNSRSETREQIDGGDGFWDGTTSTERSMKFRVRVENLPPSGNLCFAQIHERDDDFDDVIRVQAQGSGGQRSGSINLRIQGYAVEETSDRTRNLDFDFEMDREFYFELTMRRSVARLYELNNDGSRRRELFESVNLGDVDNNYFKCGSYLQTTQSSHRDSDDFGQIAIRDLEVSPND